MNGKVIAAIMLSATIIGASLAAPAAQAAESATLSDQVPQSSLSASVYSVDPDTDIMDVLKPDGTDNRSPDSPSSCPYEISPDTDVIPIPGKSEGSTSDTSLSNPYEIDDDTDVFPVDGSNPTDEDPNNDSTVFFRPIELDLINPVMADENGAISLPICDLIDFYIPDKILGCQVTEISVNAFRSCSLFRTVLIPESVTVIGANAFADCIYLERIILLGRADASDMILGSNWSGTADVVFGLVDVGH